MALTLGLDTWQPQPETHGPRLPGCVATSEAHVSFTVVTLVCNKYTMGTVGVTKSKHEHSYIVDYMSNCDDESCAVAPTLV